MKTHRASALNLAAFFLVLCSMGLINRRAAACIFGISGPTSFTAAPGRSQTLVWKAYTLGMGIISANLTSGTDVFSISQMPMDVTDSSTFTVTFTPGINATGTYGGTLTCGCGKTYDLVGTVASAGVGNSVPPTVSITIAPNPAIDNIHLVSSGVRTAMIGIFNVLGNEIASSKLTDWRFDASRLAAGTYIVRIAGESLSGDPFIISRRIIIER